MADFSKHICFFQGFFSFLSTLKLVLTY